MSASQDISTGTHTKVDFDSEYYDTDSTYDTGNQRWTPGVAGKYWVSAGLGYTNWNTSSGSVLADKTISVFIRINGSSENIKSLFHTQHTAISSTQSSVGTLTTGIMDLDNDDYIEVFTNHNSGHDAAIYYQLFIGFLDLEYLGYNMGNLYYKVKLYLEENGKTESEFTSNIMLQNNGSGDYINTWNVSGLEKPTDSQLNALNTNATKEYNNAIVRNVRESNYGKIGDQLDLLYKDIVAGKLDTTGEWAKKIKAVKDANAKE
jgi:hypothetical protein